jgi:cation/acetate symporter
VGLITSRFTGVEFGIGVFLGLAGILVCSFLGGMRAVTWTQVAQYIILIIAYMIPVVWLSLNITGVPVPQLVYGKVLERVTEREKQLTADPVEQQVRDIFKQRAEAGAKLGICRPPTATRRLWPEAGRPDGRCAGGEILAAQKALTTSQDPGRPQAKLTATRRQPPPSRRRPNRTPRPSPARMSTRATWRGATSWRWCSV